MSVLDFVTRQLATHPAVAGCASELPERDMRVAVADRVRPALLAVLATQLGTPMLVVAGGVGEAEDLTGELRNYLDASRVLPYPAHETFPWERTRPDEEGVGARLRALAALEAVEPVVVVAPVAALMRRLTPPSARLTDALHITSGDSLDLDATACWLVRAGYDRVPLVEGRGQFAVRGGILDIFPSTMQYPVRVELFGDEVDQIRRFLVSSQQSVAAEQSVQVYACRELRLDTHGAARAAVRLEKKARIDGQTREDLEYIAAGRGFDGLESYLPLLYADLATFADYLPSQAIIVLDEPKRVRDEAVQHLERVAAARGGVDASSFFLSVAEVTSLLACCRRLDLFMLADSTGLADHVVESRPVEPALGKMDRIVARISDFQSRGLATVVCLRDEGHTARLRELLAGETVTVLPPGEEPRPGSTAAVVAPVNPGFVLEDISLAVVAHGDLFPRPGRMRADHQTAAAEAARALSGLRKGEYVVHELHGVATYVGMESKQVDGRLRDYLVLVYAQGDRLFVPVEQIARVSRYVGPDAKAPKITRLSTNEWARATQRARQSVKKLAFDLARLYAERATIAGHAFAQDTVWQRELEDAFPFEETPDQLTAIAAVKSDMEQPAPMDRLVCGDVGYGKTEVAIRAAAKAVLDDRQAIVLAPTTILAQQHHATFCERFAPFPVRIEMLSRFRSHAQQRKILEDFALGKVDVLIGTHRLLQNDVVPRDLGLVVVDEEQRFGVGHKEHLKNMRKAVDVLTLTATPIPRTLQMSIAGVRDLSVIDTPPEDRFAVATEVGAYDPDRVREAIARELDRNGQVFYVYNRVMAIGAVAEKVRRLAPTARVAVAHGQMHERDLERVMRAFLVRDIDVLVCTTIIESGIDIPTANTLIVEGAERLGLGQLYQLRGRVGRSHQRAYAHFFFSNERTLTHAALERLATIREFTQLGAGMKIAMRDLEIRGAGNILGPEQHGQMSAVGFELYCQMLREAVADVRGEPAPVRPEVHILLPVDAYLPTGYVSDEELRIEAYRQIADAVDTEEVHRVRRDIGDRFGPPPEPAANLLGVAELRVTAAALGIVELGVVDTTLHIDFEDGPPSATVGVATRRGGRRVHGTGRLLIPIEIGGGLLSVAFEVLSDIMSVVDLRRDQRRNQ